MRPRRKQSKARLTTANRKFYAFYRKKEQIGRDENKLSSDPTYQSATNHFPAEGNFQAYLSPKVTTAAYAWLSAVATEKPDFDPMVEAIQPYLKEQPWSMCVSNHPTGSLRLAEMPYAISSNPATGAITMASATSVMFVGARAWKRGSDRSANHIQALAESADGSTTWKASSDRATCIHNIRKVQQAVRGHSNINDLNIGDPISWNIIEDYVPRPTCPAGGTYTLKPTIPAVGTLACTCSLAESEEHEPDDHEYW